MVTSSYENDLYLDNPEMSEVQNGDELLVFIDCPFDLLEKMVMMKEYTAID